MFWILPILIGVLLLSHFSRVRLYATPWTGAHQAPPSLGFSRQEHWSGLPFPSPNRCVVISNYCFNLKFLMIYDVEHLSICLFAISVSSWARYLFLSFVHFFITCFLLINIKSSLYILDQSLHQICLLQIFSPRLWLIFLFS